MVHGIWSLKLTSFLDFLLKHNFNAIRVPFAAELAFEMDTFVPTSVNISSNPDLEVGIGCTNAFWSLLSTKCILCGHRVLGLMPVQQLALASRVMQAK